jgi:hypothetical protein
MKRRMSPFLGVNLREISCQRDQYNPFQLHKFQVEWNLADSLVPVMSDMRMKEFIRSQEYNSKIHRW